MNFRMASTFTASMRKLADVEMKAVKTTAFDLQLDPSHPSLKFHRVARSRDPDFWTVRVNDDPVCCRATPLHLRARVLACSRARRRTIIRRPPISAVRRRRLLVARPRRLRSARWGGGTSGTERGAGGLAASRPHPPSRMIRAEARMMVRLQRGAGGDAGRLARPALLDSDASRIRLRGSLPC
jgi:hypothetical protein